MMNRETSDFQIWYLVVTSSRWVDSPTQTKSSELLSNKWVSFSFPPFQFSIELSNIQKPAPFHLLLLSSILMRQRLIFSYQQDTPFSQPQIRHLLPSSPSRPPIYPILLDLSRS